MQLLVAIITGVQSETQRSWWLTPVAEVSKMRNKVSSDTSFRTLKLESISLRQRVQGTVFRNGHSLHMKCDLHLSGRYTIHRLKFSQQKLSPTVTVLITLVSHSDSCKCTYGRTTIPVISCRYTIVNLHFELSKGRRIT